MKELINQVPPLFFPLSFSQRTSSPRARLVTTVLCGRGPEMKLFLFHQIASPLVPTKFLISSQNNPET